VDAERIASRPIANGSDERTEDDDEQCFEDHVPGGNSINDNQVSREGKSTHQPKAAGSFSSDEYSDTVKVKLLSAIPLKNPAMHIQAIIEGISVC
jgi:hypothetical protein